MPDTIETPSLPTSAEQSGREPSTAELAALGIKTEASPSSGQTSTTSTTPATPTETPADPDFVGALIKRGRPARDLSGLDEAEQKMFQSMSREAYEKLFPIYKSTKGKDLSKLETLDKLQAEYETLKKSQRPSSVYDHEEGYLLDRSYRQALVERNQLTDVQKFYTQQLAAVKANQPFHNLTQDANGNIVVDPTPIQASPAAEANLIAAISQTQQLLAAHGQKLETLKSSFGSGYKSFRGRLSEVHEKVFGQHKEFLSPLAAKELENFPEEVRDRQEIISLCHAIAMLKHIAAAHQEEQKLAGAKAANATVAQANGPTQRAMPAAPKGDTAIKMTSDEDFRNTRLKFGF